MGYPSYASILVVGGIGLLLFIILVVILKIVNKAYEGMMDTRVTKALLRRRNHRDRFRDENGYSWDYIFAFKVYNEGEAVTYSQRLFNVKFILQQLGAGGLDIRLFYSTQVRCLLDSFWTDSKWTFLFLRMILMHLLISPEYIYIHTARRWLT